MNLLSISINNLKRRKSRALLLLLGLVISAGTALTLIVLGRGMTGDIAHRLDEYGANIVIVPETEGLTLSYGGLTVFDRSAPATTLTDTDLERLRTIRNAENISIVAPKLVGRASLNGAPILSVGVRFPDEFRLKRWWRIAAGHRPSEPHEILIGADVARRRDLSAGENVMLDDRKVTVAGVLAETGDQDDGLIFAELAFSRDLLNAPGRLSIIELAALCTGCPIEDIVAQISSALPGARVKAMKETLDLKMQAVRQFRLFSYGVSGVIGLVAALIVFITVTSSVGERKKEIGIFRAVGYRRNHIVRIICSEALFVGLAGGLIGGVLGTLLPRVLGPFLVHTRDLALPLDGAATVMTIIGTGAVALLASLYPAIRAARLDPVEALRDL